MPTTPRRSSPSCGEVAEERRWIGTEPGFDVEERIGRVRAAIEGGEAYWVLEDDAGSVVGILGLHPTHARGVLTFGMSVVAAARGRGGGRALLEAALEHLASGRTSTSSSSRSGPTTARAIALYARYGFEVEGLRRSHYRRRDGSLRSSLIMARLLRSCDARAARQSRPGAGT